MISPITRSHWRTRRVLWSFSATRDTRNHSFTSLYWPTNSELLLHAVIQHHNWPLHCLFFFLLRLQLFYYKRLLTAAANVFLWTSECCHDIVLLLTNICDNCWIPCHRLFDFAAWLWKANVQFPAALLQNYCHLITQRRRKPLPSPQHYWSHAIIHHQLWLCKARQTSPSWHGQ